MIRKALVAGVVAGMFLVSSAILIASDDATGEPTPMEPSSEQQPELIGGIYMLTAYGQTSDAANNDAVALETATFGAGCFWGAEAHYRNMDGVVATAVGYSGGHKDKTTYKEVCGDGTGHAEVVQLKYDPSVVSYEKLLTVFWNNHNPTQLNRQGPDVGTQYRSAVFYHSDAQREAAEKSKGAVAESGTWNKPIVTEITEADEFFPAEDYHQQYLEKRGQASCGVPSSN